MAYFSNGMEGDWYRERYCERCVHDINEDCPVWLVHILYNYDQFNDDNRGEDLKAILSALWPLSIDNHGTHNSDCKMFIQKETEEHNEP